MIKATQKHVEICMRYANNDLNLIQAKYRLCSECNMNEQDAIQLLDEFNKDAERFTSFTNSIAITILIVMILSLITTIALFSF